MTRFQAMKRGAAAIVLGTALSAGAAEPRVLPALNVVTLDGTAVEAHTVVKPGRWLLAYVRPQSGGSRSFVAALEKARAAAPEGVAVVVGGDLASARALADGFPGLRQASWYVDVRGDAFRALGLSGVPVVLGLREGAIEWSLAGVVPDRKTLPSVLASW
jgi:hypothetical protein